MQASSELDAEVKKLTSERQRLATEVQMKREMEQQYAKRCTLQVITCLTLSSPENHMHSRLQTCITLDSQPGNIMMGTHNLLAPIMSANFAIFRLLSVQLRWPISLIPAGCVGQVCVGQLRCSLCGTWSKSL